ncbi:LOW QUALITY PROTEIN: PPR domain-containing protein/PPR_2 domain-containing protein, partial [Cephalotus follicularis]
YNTMIRALAQNSQPLRAFFTFFEMQRSGVFADNFTYPFLLKACSCQNRLPTVKMIHAHVEKCGFRADIIVPNSLIDTYSKCGEMNISFDIFERMPQRNVVSWSTMVSGYSKDGDMDMARMLFDKMPIKNLVTWTIIISGYEKKGLVKEATGLYDQMEEAGLKPDDGAFISILAASAESGSLGLGVRVHASIERTRIKCTTSISNALVDMYAKNGRLDKALSVFNDMAERDIVSWNAMLQGLAMHGLGEEALRLFSRMKREGFEPDKVTFIGVLCACTHAGFVDKGIHYFAMERDYGIVPEIEHGCMTDLLGRGGRIKEAYRLVLSMPFEPNAIIWGTLLGACRMHNDVSLAEEVFDSLIKLKSSDPGNFSMLSNIFAAAGDWDSFASVRLRMKSVCVQKSSGVSSIEVEDQVHKFTVLDKSHSKSDDIYHMIDKLSQDIKLVGYVP